MNINEFRENLKIVGFAIYLQKRHLWKISFTDIRLILLRWVTQAYIHM